MYMPRGVIPAVILPFHEDFSIDERAFRAHLRNVASVEGLGALTVNGHASEVASCTFEEQRRVLEMAAEEVGSGLPLIAGVCADSALQGARIARMAERVGASALLVFPSGAFALGTNRDMVVDHFKRIADAASLPLVLFQYPVASGLSYDLDTLHAILDAVPSVRAIKDWCGDPQTHEKQIRSLHGRSRPVSILSAHSAWLLSSLVLGCDGILSGSGSVVAQLQADIFQAVQQKKLLEAQAISDRLFPLMDDFYSAPVVDMHNRMKEALVLLGRLPRAVVRPPLQKLPRERVQRIRRSLVAAGLLM